MRHKFEKSLMALALCVALISHSELLFSNEAAGDLVAYYPFNGNAHDESGNANDANVNGAILVPDRFGYPDSAYYFDGIDDYLSANPIGFVNEHTIAMWFYVESLASDPDNVLVENTDSLAVADYGLYALYQSDAPDKFQIYYFLRDESDIPYMIVDEHQYEVGGWHHLAATYDGQLAILYVDGQQVVSSTLEIVVRQEGTSIGIGDDIPGGDAGLHGLIDDVRIYNRAFSSLEIYELFREQTMSIYLPIISK